jgi:PRTRC genetic system protein B
MRKSKKLQPALNFADLPPEALDATPRAAVVLTDESAWLARYDARGERTALYPVTAADVATAFNHRFGSSTGLLPEGVLFWQHTTGQGDRLGLWLPPARRTLRFGGRIASLSLMLPGLVFVGCGARYWLYASPERPSAAHRLYRAPLPNVHGHDGLICQGSVRFPKCTAATVRTAATLFFESEFNYDLLDGNLVGDNPVKTLRSLSKAREFPARLLVPSITVAQLLGGEHD